MVSVRYGGRRGRPVRFEVADDLVVVRTRLGPMLGRSVPTRGVAAVEPYLTRYLPALVVAAVLPPATLLTMAAVDWPAALTAAVTLPLVPVFAVLVGLATRDRADRQWRLLSSLSGHFVDLVRGLPTLVSYNRAALQGARIRAVTARYRDATLATLKVAFASSAVLELVATLGPSAMRRRRGEGQVKLILPVPELGQEIEIDLPGLYAVSTEIRGAIKSVPGVQAVRLI